MDKASNKRKCFYTISISSWEKAIVYEYPDEMRSAGEYTFEYTLLTICGPSGVSTPHFGKNVLTVSQNHSKKRLNPDVLPFDPLHLSSDVQKGLTCPEEATCNFLN